MMPTTVREGCDADTERSDMRSRVVPEFSPTRCRNGELPLGAAGLLLQRHVGRRLLHTRHRRVWSHTRHGAKRARLNSRGAWQVRLTVLGKTERYARTVRLAGPRGEAPGRQVCLG